MGSGVLHMIDVSRFRMGDPCPRCLGRRVYALDVNTDEWACIPNAEPFPVLRPIIHSATASCDNPEGAFALMETARREVNHGR